MDRWKDRRRDKRRDRQTLFHRTLLATDRGSKYCINVLSAVANQRNM